MTHPTSLHDRIFQFFSSALHVDVPGPDTDLFDAGVLDSLAFIELLVHLEQEFGVTTSVDDLDIERFRSIGRISEFVMGRIAVASDAFAGSRIVSFGATR